MNLGKKKICPNCKQEIKDSKVQRVERGGVMRMLKMIRAAGIQEKNEETKEFCYECWKKELRAFMKPYAQALGKSAEDW